MDVTMLKKGDRIFYKPLKECGTIIEIYALPNRNQQERMHLVVEFDNHPNPIHINTREDITSCTE